MDLYDFHTSASVQLVPANPTGNNIIVHLKDLTRQYNTRIKDQATHAWSFAFYTQPQIDIDSKHSNNGNDNGNGSGYYTGSIPNTSDGAGGRNVFAPRFPLHNGWDYRFLNIIKKVIKRLCSH